MAAYTIPDFAVSLDEFAEMLVDIYIPGNIPVMIWSPPGWGKSAKIRQAIVERLKMRVIFVYGSAMQECDANGLPNFAVIEDGERITVYTTPQLIIECRKGPTVVVFDELPRASVQVLNSLLPAFSPERSLGVHKFPDDTRFVAAGNNCGSGNTTLPEAMEDRWGHLYLMLKFKEFLKWGGEAGISACVLAHLQMHPEALYELERTKGEKGHASPRKWEEVSKLTDKVLELLDPTSGKPKFNKEQVRAMVAGEVGEGHARQYVAFMDLLKDIEPIPYIISNPSTAKVPEKPDYKYVIVAALARHATPGNIKNISTYLARLPEEFQLMCMSSAVRRDPSLLRTPEYIRHSVKTAELVS